MIKDKLLQLKFRSKNNLLILVIVAVLLASIIELFPKESTRTPSWFGIKQCMSIAISELKFGLTGNIGYRKIYEALLPLPGGDQGTPIHQMNDAMALILEMKDVSGSGTHYNIGTGAGRGMTDFMKLSYVIFGFNAQALFYLYIVLLTVSVSTYVASFRENPIYLYIGLLFITSYLLVLQAPIVKHHSALQVSFLPVLTILPTIYLSLILIDKQKPTYTLVAGSIVQSGILVFSYYLRSTSKYQFMFFACLLVYLLYRNVKSNNAGIRKFIAQCWPLYSLVAVVLFLQFYSKVLVSRAGRKRVSTDMHYPHQGTRRHPGYS